MTRLATKRMNVPVERLAAAVRELEIMSSHSLEEYRTSPYVRRAVERLIQLVVDLACEINCCLVVRGGGRMPEGYEESFTALARGGVLPEQVSGKMLAMVALRHQLMYDTDPAIDESVHRRLPYFTVLLREYGRHVEAALRGGSRN